MKSAVRKKNKDWRKKNPNHKKREKKNQPIFFTAKKFFQKNILWPNEFFFFSLNKTNMFWSKKWLCVVQNHGQKVFLNYFGWKLNYFRVKVILLPSDKKIPSPWTRIITRSASSGSTDRASLPRYTGLSDEKKPTPHTFFILIFNFFQFWFKIFFSIFNFFFRVLIFQILVFFLLFDVFLRFFFIFLFILDILYMFSLTSLTWSHNEDALQQGQLVKAKVQRVDFIGNDKHRLQEFVRQEHFHPIARVMRLRLKEEDETLLVAQETRRVDLKNTHTHTSCQPFSFPQLIPNTPPHHTHTPPPPTHPQRHSTFLCTLKFAIGYKYTPQTHVD